MKILLIIFSLLIGGFMLIDGIHVMVKGKYIGPEKPGPWANIFSSMNIDVFRLGPLFITYGLLWLFFLYAFLANYSWANLFGIILSVLTLWYLPVGTILSVVVIGILIYMK